MGRNIHQLPGAGSADGEETSAGDAPRAPSGPDLGPAPPHLTGDGQINRQHAAHPHSSRPAPSPPAFNPLATKLPPTPERRAAEGWLTCSLAAPSTTTPERGSRSAPKGQRRRPRHASAAQKPLFTTPERRSGDSPPSRRRSGRRRGRNPADTPVAAGKTRVAREIASVHCRKGRVPEIGRVYVIKDNVGKKGLGCVPGQRRRINERI